MTDQSRALVHAITGPVILITVGSLFALDKFSGYSFRQAWPVLIIVIGLLKLFGGGRRWRRRYQYGAGGYQAPGQAPGFQAGSFQAVGYQAPYAGQAPSGAAPNSTMPGSDPGPRPGVRQ